MNIATKKVKDAIAEVTGGWNPSDPRFPGVKQAMLDFTKFSGVKLLGDEAEVEVADIERTFDILTDYFETDENLNFACGAVQSLAELADGLDLPKTGDRLYTVLDALEDQKVRAENGED